MKIYHIIKRSLDIIVSFIGITALMPVFIIISIWIKSTSKGPIIYEHTRIGKDGIPFKIYKFRTMIVGARDLQQKGFPEEKLITSAGKFLRKSFLDETAQLLNILKGDMSLVGPRPKDVETFKELLNEDPAWKDIVKIKPGLTSLESVADYLSGIGRINFEKHFKGLLSKDDYDEHKSGGGKYYRHVLLLDDYYIKNRSLTFDIKIIMFTMLLMIRRMCPACIIKKKTQVEA